ncbi:hypothetical protein [Nocardia sp. NBC_00511]|uniref:DUF7373 family lipoprotein n=1 Tax=Nocardia sp. NBC_00511 TaxID=2903591 RepID=UPI0030DEBEA0
MAAAVVLAVSVFASAGCGSESHAGDQKTVDLSKLDVGAYATQPKDIQAKDPASWAKYLEAFRLASVMPLAQDVDPTLTVNVPDVNPFINSDDFIADQLAGNKAAFGWLNMTEFDANTPGLVAGFQTGAESNEDSNISIELKNAVMLFDSDTSATAAATALARSGFGKPEGTEPAHSTQYPNAQIVWKPQYQALASWYPTGRYVILALAINHENSALGESDQSGLISLTDKAISVTSDRLKAFQPTPKDKLADLPADPQKMLRMTLRHPAGDQLAFFFPGTLDAHGAVLTAGYPNDNKTLFDQTGVDFVSYGAGRVIRTRDTSAAETFIATVSSAKFQHPIDPPPGLPDARCVEYHGPQNFDYPFHCYAAYGRYAAEIGSTQKQDVYQRISAQYSILANSR